MEHVAAVLTISDRSSAGERVDGSGPRAVAALHAAGWSCDPATVVPDGAESVETALRRLLAEGIRLIVTTGGTGVALSDETPEGTAAVVSRMVPGVAEELRRRSTAQKPAGMLSRGIAGIAGNALIVNLPGSPAAVDDGMPVVLSVASHVMAQLDGDDHR